MGYTSESGQIENSVSKTSVSTELSPSLGVAIPRAVAEATGREPTDGPPLQKYVDIDALDRLIASNSSEIEVEFTYDGVRVTVEGDGTVRVNR